MQTLACLHVHVCVCVTGSCMCFICSDVAHENMDISCAYYIHFSHAPAKLFVCRLFMHALVVCHPVHRPTAQAHWSAPMIDGNGMVIVGRSDGSMYKALPVLPHPASQWLVQ